MAVSSTASTASSSRYRWYTISRYGSSSERTPLPLTTHNSQLATLMKATRLAILGSTGSIGRQTLDVVRSLPERFNVIALAAGGNVTLLEEQAREFRPRFVCASREEDYVRERIPARWAAMEGMAANPDVDLV